MKKLNKYLVGGKGLPMKFIQAATPAEAMKVWKKKTKREKDTPAITVVGQEKEKQKAAPKKKEDGGSGKQEGEA